MVRLWIYLSEYNPCFFCKCFRLVILNIIQNSECKLGISLSDCFGNGLRQEYHINIVVIL